MQAKNELQRDALVITRHLTFIGGVIAVALLVALASGFIFASGYKARAVVQVQTNVLPLPSSIKQPVILDIAKSPEVAQEAVNNYGSGTVSSLSDRVTVTERPEGLRVEATSDSKSDAIRLANTWAAAIETVINSSDIGPAAGEALQRESENAKEQLTDAEQAVASANTNGVEPSQTVLDEVSKSLAADRAELDTLTRATDTVRQAVSSGATITQLRVALAGLVPPEILGSVDNSNDLLQALDLRRQVLQTTVDQEAQQLSTLQAQRRDLMPLLLEREAAQNNYRDTVKTLNAAELGPITARISEPADHTSGAGLSWPQRLGAALVFGVVVGIIGAFVIDSLPPMRRWFKTPQEVKSP